LKITYTNVIKIPGHFQDGAFVGSLSLSIIPKDETLDLFTFRKTNELTFGLGSFFLPIIKKILHYPIFL
jgi:hypothetical protein